MIPFTYIEIIMKTKSTKHSLIALFDFSPFIEIFNPATKEWRPIFSHDMGGGQPKPRAGHCAVRHRVKNDHFYFLVSFFLPSFSFFLCVFLQFLSFYLFVSFFNYIYFIFMFLNWKYCFTIFTSSWVLIKVMSISFFNNIFSCVGRNLRDRRWGWRRDVPFYRRFKRDDEHLEKLPEDRSLEPSIFGLRHRRWRHHSHFRRN